MVAVFIKYVGLLSLETKILRTCPMVYAVQDLQISEFQVSTVHSGQLQEKSVVQHTEARVLFRENPICTRENRNHQKIAHMT